MPIEKNQLGGCCKSLKFKLSRTTMIYMINFYFILKHSLFYIEVKWQPIPVFLPGESQGQGSLVGCHPWGPTESDMTEVT